MSCKRHPYETGVGVCASCLRERLLTLIASQNKLSSAVPDEYCFPRRSDPNLNPSPPSDPHLPFPRSTSPYFSRRRSLGSGAPRPIDHISGDVSGQNPHRSNSLWSSVFGHSGSGSSFSWLSALVRKKKSAKLCEPGSPLDRGMSTNGGDFGLGFHSSPVRRLPGPTPNRLSGRGISGFAVCLSPMVRSNPNRRRSYGLQHSDVTLPGEPRFSSVNDQIRRHLSFGDSGSVGPNRSRKLSDFGRFK